MSKIKSDILTLAVSGALFMCAASNLVAEDIPGNWYLGLGTGLALQQDITLKNNGETELSFEPGFRLGLSGGAHLSKSWKAEVEMGFIFNSVDGGSEEYFQMPVLANGIYTLQLNERLSVYVGAGLGGVYSALWNLWDADDSFTFGYQGIVGAKYAITDTFDLGLSYKLLGTVEHNLGPYTADGTLSHSILAAFTFKF